MTHVLLVRHGEADYGPINDRGWPGFASELAPLTPDGIAQAVAAADQLAGAGATYLVSAPATRALHTAAVIGHRLALGVRVDFDLREWAADRAGAWRGLADIRAALRDFEAYEGESVRAVRGSSSPTYASGSLPHCNDTWTPPRAP